MTGDVLDFETTMPLGVMASVSVTDLSPTPRAIVTGSSFEIDGVPANSTFPILASAPPTHHQTYSPPIVVVDADVTGAKAYAVSEMFLSNVETGFGVTPSAGAGILLLHLVDSTGAAKSGVAGSNIVLANGSGASGPKFLDASLAPAPNATSSSASGWVMIFEVPTGIATLGQAANATATLAMPSSTVAAGTVTIANVVVTDGAPPPPPANISFATQIFPIFKNRGCVACHSGNGPGKDLGNLTLDGSANLVYKELVQETPYRVVVATPETSLVLTMPSAESPPDAHPNVTFTGPQDPDYVKILTWIREGAKQN